MKHLLSILCAALLVGCADVGVPKVESARVATDNGSVYYVPHAVGWAEIEMPVFGERFPTEWPRGRYKPYIITVVWFFDRDGDTLVYLPKHGIKEISHWSPRHEAP